MTLVCSRGRLLAARGTHPRDRRYNHERRIHCAEDRPRRHRDQRFQLPLPNLDPERTREELAVLALKEALDDAGLDKSDIDGLVVGGSPEYHSFMFRSGLQDVRYLAHYPIAGRLCPIALGQAAMAIEHGMCNYVAMFNSVNFRSAARSFGAPSEGTGDLYDSVFGMASPGAFYSLAFTRYQQLYGGTEEELGAISVAFRKHASMNPRAVMQNPITIDDYMSARYIAKPLRLFDYCLVNDGAVCYILTSADRAKDLKQPPVHVGGFGMRTSIRENTLRRTSGRPLAPR